MTSDPSRLACRLCGQSDNLRKVQERDYASVWQEVETLLDIRFKTEVVRRLTPSKTVSLWECLHCGLSSFHPAVAGDGEFYSALAASPAYYVESRWEMHQILRTLKPGYGVLDFGAGEGAFLRQARARGCSVAAVEISEHARRALSSSGITSYESIDHLAGTQFDVVVSIQTIEHLDTVAVLLKLSQTLSRGGSMYLAVPSPQRVETGGAGLDFPPHHLSRWSRAPFVWLARHMDLRLEWVRYEPLPPRRYLRSRLRGSSAGEPSDSLEVQPSPGFARRAYWRALSPLVGHRLPIYGHSMLARLVRD